MVNCRACGTSNRVGARFCVRCGAGLGRVNCPNCGASNRDTAKFCGKCRTALSRTCSRCGEGNRPQANVCRRCGNRLTVVCPRCQTANRPSARYCRHCAANLRLPGAPQQRAGTGRLPSGERLNQRYTVVRKLAQGGMGAVYLVNDRHQPGSTWALKEMSLSQIDAAERADTVRAFHREADLLMQLEHPNLVKVVERFSQNGREYLVMEYVEGQTLEALSGGGPMDEAQVLAVALQLCDVLDYLHGQPSPIIYRDLKPANVMVETQTGRVKLIDFGIVRFHKPGQRQDTHVLGTPGYAAPEQYGGGQTNACSDVFSLGVTLYVLLTAYDVEQNPLKFPDIRSLRSDVSPRLAGVIEKAVKLEMDERYPSAASMRRALLRCRGAKKVAAALPSTKEVQRPSFTPTPPGLVTPAPAPPVAAYAPAPVQPPPVHQPSSPSVSRLVVAPPTLSFQARWPQRAEKHITVISPSGQPVRTTVRSHAAWLEATPPDFIGDQEDVTIAVRTEAISLPRVQRSTPPLLGRAWDWAEEKGADRRFWEDLDSLGMTLAAGAPALLVGGLGQVLAWWFYRHAYYLTPGTAIQDEMIEIDYHGGRVQVPVHVEVAPAPLREWTGWVLSGAAVLAELGLLGLVIHWMLS